LQQDSNISEDLAASIYITLKMEAARSSKMFVSYCNTMHCHPRRP